MNEEHWMRHAIGLSRRALETGQGGPFGAVIVREDVVVAGGHNEVLATLDPTAHAEVNAIRRACQALQRFDLSDCVMFTSCEPCPMCLGAIYWARIQAVYFANTRADAAEIGFDDEFFYQELGLPILERRLKMVPLLREEAIIVFRDFSADPQRRIY